MILLPVERHSSEINYIVSKSYGELGNYIKQNEILINIVETSSQIEVKLDSRIDLATNYYIEAQKLNPDNLEIKYWYAVTLLNNNQNKKAEKVFIEIFKIEKRWKEITLRFYNANLLKISQKELQKIIKP